MIEEYTTISASGLGAEDPTAKKETREAWLLTAEGEAWLATGKGRRWRSSQVGVEWLASPAGQAWVAKRQALNETWFGRNKWLVIGGVGAAAAIFVLPNFLKKRA